MTKFLKNTFIAAALIAIGFTSTGLHAATPAAKGAAPAWAQRCEKGSKYCEVFQQLSVQKKDEKQAQRLIEFAVGYPPGKKGVARGVFILPLGILVNQDTVVTIDGKAEFAFKVRYCDQNGCVAFLDLPDSATGAMRKGKKMTVGLVAMNGQKINIEMVLEGFGPALDKIKG